MILICLFTFCDVIHSVGLPVRVCRIFSRNKCNKPTRGRGQKLTSQSIHAVHLRLEINDATVYFKFNPKSLCITCTVGEVRSGMGPVLTPIASASQHEVAPWFVTAVV